MKRLAILGGAPAFPDGLRFARPTTPSLDDVVARLRPSYDDAILTNGPLVRELEERAAIYLGVRRVVAVSTCTSGLMLVLRAVGTKGSVVLPSMTFSATAHAVAWNGAESIFAECDVASYQLDAVDAATRVAADTSALVATHCFGAPCDVETTLAVGRDAGIPVVFDAAHGFGAERAGTRLGGFGAAEIFSLSPTKLVISGEGGLVATNDDSLADQVAIGRDYGNPGNYDTQFPGLNARMSELHAAMALASFDLLDEVLAARRHLAARYRTALAAIAGVEGQRIGDGDLSTFKDLSVTVDAARFGIDRDRLAVVLKADGIDTRPYFYPAVHQQTAYRRADRPSLPATDLAASRALSLPIYPALTEEIVDRVIEVVAAAHRSAEELTGTA